MRLEKEENWGWVKRAISLPLQIQEFGMWVREDQVLWKVVVKLLLVQEDWLTLTGDATLRSSYRGGAVMPPLTITIGELGGNLSSKHSHYVTVFSSFNTQGDFHSFSPSSSFNTQGEERGSIVHWTVMVYWKNFVIPPPSTNDVWRKCKKGIYGSQKF